MLEKYRENLIFLISLTISVLTYVLICKLLSGNHIFYPDISSYAQYFLDASFLKPEPFERFCFVFGLIYLPLSFLLSYILLDRAEEKHKFLFPFYSGEFFNKIQNIVIVSVMFLWGYYILKGAELGFECWIFKIYLNYYWLRIVLVLFVLSLLFRNKFNKLNSPVFFIVGIITILATSLTQIHTNKIMMSNPFINAHFGLLTGAINQVSHGKMVLVDIFSQYGVLYPYIGALFTKIFGFSILNISLFFVLLIFLSFLFIYMALSEKIGYNSWFSFISLIAVIGISHMFYVSIILFGGVNNTYYQYHPIRVIFGSFFIWFALKYLKNSSTIKYIIGLFMCGISFLWNFDTGVPLVISWLGFLIFNTLSVGNFTTKEKLVKSFKHLLFMGITLVSIMAVYDFAAYLHSNRLPNWNEIVELQKLFVILGFYMAPMRKIDLWNIVIIVYILVLFSCLVALLKKKATDSHRYYIFIALFGIGIFSYYQGRSLVSNLFILTYPAVILTAFLLDDFSRRYLINKNNIRHVLNNNIFRFDLIKMFFLSIIFAYGIVAFFTKLPDLYKWVKYDIKSIAEVDKPADIYINFIIENKKSDETIIFSDISDYLYCLTGTFSSLPYSSTIEAVTSLQWKKIREVIESKKTKQIFYGVGIVPGKFNDIIYPALLENYNKTGQSADGGLLLYEVKK